MDGYRVIKLTYEKFAQMIQVLSDKIPSGRFDAVYGIPRGGVPVAIALGAKLGLPVVQSPGPNTLVCDDICDSGATLSRYEDSPSAVLYVRDSSQAKVEYFAEIENAWVEFPWEEKEMPAEDAIIRLLQYIGEDPQREGLLDTPKRVIKSYKELFSGYKQDAEKVLGTTFDSHGYNQIVILKDIEMYSTCEHHMIPFVGTVSVGYIPGKRVVGLSKLARLVEVFSRRLQIQEKLTEQIADTVMNVLQPQGAMVIVKAKHFCMCARGVNKQNSWMITSAIRGRFEEAPIRQEFMALTGTP